MSARLVDPELGTLELAPEAGFRVTQLDLGYPATRAVVAERVNANGSDDRTQFYGSRAVALTCLVQPGAGRSRSEQLDRLRAFASPSRRPVLLFDEDGTGRTRRLMLRGEQLGWPLVSAVSATVQVSWVAPEGIIESATEQDAQVSAVPPSTPGRRYPRTYPLSYPDVSFIGAVNARNDGTEPAAPVLRMWGPCTDPALINASTGDEVALSGLTLTGDQFVEVDVREATVRLNGRVDQSLYASLDFTRSALWWLTAGDNYVRYQPGSYGTGAHATITFRSAWL